MTTNLSSAGISAALDLHAVAGAHIRAGTTAVQRATQGMLRARSAVDRKVAAHAAIAAVGFHLECDAVGKVHGHVTARGIELAVADRLARD